MPRKKKTVEQIQKELKHQRRIDAGNIKDIYPNVKEIALDFKFENPDGLAISPSYKPSCSSYKRLPQHSAFFEVECKDRECVNGGFGLTNEITNMIRDHKTKISGQLTCQGWQDRERVGQYRCGSNLIYKISVIYQN